MSGKRPEFAGLHWRVLSKRARAAEKPLSPSTSVKIWRYIIHARWTDRNNGTRENWDRNFSQCVHWFTNLSLYFFYFSLSLSQIFNFFFVGLFYRPPPRRPFRRRLHSPGPWGPPPVGPATPVFFLSYHPSPVISNTHFLLTVSHFDLLLFIFFNLFLSRQLIKRANENSGARQFSAADR